MRLRYANRTYGLRAGEVNLKYTMNYPQTHHTEHNKPLTNDNVVFFQNTKWEDYQRLLAIRGDHAIPQINYLEGYIEIMSPSSFHEDIKSKIGRLVEVYCLEKDIEFHTLGAWTLETTDHSRGAEPDECYIFDGKAVLRPDLVIEVIWTSGRIDKLDIYRKLNVAEVWIWQNKRIQPYALRGESYTPIANSEVLPGINLELLTSFLDQPTTYAAIRGFRSALQTEG